MLVKEINKCLNGLLNKPFFTLQGYYEMKDVRPNFRFGYCCRNLAEEIVKCADRLGYKSYILFTQNGLNSSAISEDKKGNKHLAIPALLVKESVNISEVIGNPNKSVHADFYSNIPNAQVEIRGIEDGFVINEPTTGWYWGERKIRKHKFVLNDKYIGPSFPRDPKTIQMVVPLIRVLDFEKEIPTPLSMLFGYGGSTLIKDYDGRRAKDNTEKVLENRIMELMGNGINVQELRQYVFSCFNLYGKKRGNGSS